MNSCHGLWGCGVAPMRRGYRDYPHLVRTFPGEQGSNLGVLLCAFQPEQSGGVGLVVVVVVADECVLSAVVEVLRLEHDADVVVVLADVVDAVAAVGDVVAALAVVDVVVVGGWPAVEPAENVKVDGNDVNGEGDERLALKCPWHDFRH